MAAAPDLQGGASLNMLAPGVCSTSPERINALMSAQPNDTKIADGADLRFGSGNRTIRSEDAPLLTGRGQFTDDLDVAGQAYAAFVTDHSRPCRHS